MHSLKSLGYLNLNVHWHIQKILYCTVSTFPLFFIQFRSSKRSDEITFLSDSLLHDWLREIKINPDKFSPTKIGCFWKVENWKICKKLRYPHIVVLLRNMLLYFPKFLFTFIPSTSFKPFWIFLPENRTIDFNLQFWTFNSWYQNHRRAVWFRKFK